MKCTHCGTELGKHDTLCSFCGQPVKVKADGSAADAGAGNSGPDLEKPEKKKGKAAAVIAIAAAVIAIAAFAAVKLTAKDPKETVIAAFENIWPKDQVSPAEELFGASEFAKYMSAVDSEASLNLKLDSCSDEMVNQFAGTGIRFAGKNDFTNKTSSFHMGVTYNDMDAASLNVYYGDDTLMAAIPELSDKVLTLDLGDGLADRVKNSPAVSAYLAQNGVDVETMASFLQEMMDEAVSQQESGTAPFDVAALMTRYREGCEAQENFKAALLVEKNGKGTFVMDGKEVTCTGYQVTVSKNSMIEFLRLSSDFFLQDETLKNDFLKQLEASVRMSQLMGADVYGGAIQTPEELQQQTYEELKKSVDDMIAYLDGSLTDVQMTVYVDKSGRLASVDGKTAIREYTEAAETEGTEAAETEAAQTAQTAAAEAAAGDIAVDVAFKWNLKGGAYLTQNMDGSVTLSNPEDAAETVSVKFSRQGTYDETALTDDVSIDFDGGSMEQTFNLMYSSTYSVQDGSFHVEAEAGSAGIQLLKVSGTGVVDELEKGKSLRVTLDELETSVMENSVYAVMSGDYSLMPLQSEVAAPQGEPMDVLAATPEEWQQLVLGGLFSAMGVMQELGIQ